MHYSRLAAAGIGLAVAGALVLTISAPASAALLTPSSYPHQQSLTGGVLTVQVSNATSKTASCWISVHEASTEAQLGTRASAVNTQINMGTPSALLDNARAQAAQGALHILADGTPIATSASVTLNWESGRPDTSYAIYQDCTTPDPVTGLTINGLAQVYKVTGTGAAGRFENVTAVPTVSGTGRLGTSFTASYDATGVTPAPTSVAFTWHTSDGTVVGTGPTFTPTNALLGQSLYATAVLSRADYDDYVTLGSTYTATVSLADHTPGAAPVITGRTVVGGVLTASVDTSGWAPVPDSFDYRWHLADGTPIAGADQATLAVTTSLGGASVYVVATARTTDHVDYEIASAPVSIATPVIVADAPTVQAGGTITVRVSGLLPGEDYTVELHSDPVVLGAVRADADGTIQATFRIPATAAPGQHTIVALHQGAAVATLAVTVTAAAGIAATGADLRGLWLAAMLLLAGAGAVLASRRRPTT